MNSLKKIIIASSAALTMTGVAASIANAQPYRYYGDRSYSDRYYGAGIEERRERRTDRLTTAFVDSLNWRVQNAAREGRINWREAQRLQNDLNSVKPLAWRYQNGQARQWEVDRLQQTVDRVTDELRG
jgi:hypothetical protein